jgi:ATP-binding cassette subfamily B protein
VLHQVCKDAVVIADPGRGVERLPRREFGRRWTGYLLLLAPTDVAPPAAAGAAPAGPWRRFLGLLRPHAGLLAEAFVCALLMTVLGLSTSYFLQQLVDSVLARGESRLLNALGAGMVGLLLFRALFGALRQYLLAHLGRHIDLSLVSGYARHVLRLPLRVFEARQVGEILSRVHDTAKVREAVGGTALTALVDGTLVAVLLAVLWLYDLPLAALATAFAPLLLAGALAHHPPIRRGARAAMEKGALVSAHLVEDVSGVETVKAFGAEELRAEGGEKHLVGLVQAGFALQKLALSTDTLGLVVTAGAGLAILWYGGHRVIAGALTIGELMFFYSLLGFLLDPLQRLASVNLKVQDALVAVDRLYQILDLEAERLADAGRARFEGVREGLVLQDVGFRYGSRGPVLEGVNLRVPAGKTVAIVGESGSGKSMLLKLLMGFYAPTEGRVLIDGVDLRDLDLASLRGGLGLVAQEPFVFSGSVRDNIALARPGAPLDEVIAAARAAGLEEFINALPERYDTVIGERGANLSGGQRQRLAIARALVRRPDVLIFDEATSHLDTATERAIQESLRTALAGKTVVLVAHRLSTIRQADLIYVLARGRVVESGSHAELLALGGWYAALWAAQVADGPGAAPALPCNGHRRNGKASAGGVSHD